MRRCCWSPQGKQFAVGTDIYRGIDADVNEPPQRRAQVLLFELKNP
jgi:hypothetical protein